MLILGASVLANPEQLSGALGRTIISVDGDNLPCFEPAWSGGPILSWQSAATANPFAATCSPVAAQAAARDLIALRERLGLARWDVVAIGQTAVPAAAVTLIDKDGVRTLAIDRPRPPDLSSLASQLAIVGVFLDECRRAPSCSALFPSLKRRFEITLEHLATAPARVMIAGQTRQLTATDIITLAAGAVSSADADIQARVPNAIAAAEDGRYALLLSTGGYYADNPAPHAAQESSASAPVGLEASRARFCESVDANTRRQLDGDGWSAQIISLLQASAPAGPCGLVRQVAPDVTPKPAPSVPTLIFDQTEGRPDAVERPADTPAGLRRLIVLPWLGTSALSRFPACSDHLLAAFLAEPATALDDSCARNISEPAWVHGDSPMAILQASVRNSIASSAIPGRSVYMIDDDSGIRGVAAAGWRDPAAKSLLDGGETFRVASQTKTFTAAAVLRLVEQDKISVDEPIGSLISPELRHLLEQGGYDPSQITVSELLRHTSGLPDYAEDSAFQDATLKDPHHHWTRSEQVRWAVTRLTPIGRPGERFLYSDTGYLLLGDIVERVTGEDQAAAYRHLLGYERLGLRHTWFEGLEPAPADAPPRAHQFVTGIDYTEAEPSFDLYGGGGLVSTLEDQAAFYRALFNGRVFDHPGTLALMITVPASNQGHGDFGMGLKRVVFEGVDCWGHSGFWGSSTYFCPALSLTVAASRFTVDEPPGYDSQAAFRAAITTARLPHPVGQRP